LLVSAGFEEEDASDVVFVVVVVGLTDGSVDGDVESAGLLVGAVFDDDSGAEPVERRNRLGEGAIRRGQAQLGLSAIERSWPA